VLAVAVAVATTPTRMAPKRSGCCFDSTTTTRMRWLHCALGFECLGSWYCWVIADVFVVPTTMARKWRKYFCCLALLSMIVEDFLSYNNDPTLLGVSSVLCNAFHG